MPFIDLSKKENKIIETDLRITGLMKSKHVSSGIEEYSLIINKTAHNVSKDCYNSLKSDHLSQKVVVELGKGTELFLKKHNHRTTKIGSTENKPQDHFELTEGLKPGPIAPGMSTTITNLNLYIIIDDVSDDPTLKMPRKRPKKLQLKKARPPKYKPKIRKHNKPNRFVRGSKRSDN